MKRVLALTAVLLLLAGCADDNVDPARNDHAKHCLGNGFHIKTHDQFGGKYNTTTYWCEDLDGQITDIWFER